MDRPTARRVLGVAAGASAEEITTAFRARARRAHPDHGGDADEFRDLVEAHDVLTASAASTVSAPPIVVPRATVMRQLVEGVARHLGWRPRRRRLE